MIYLGTSEDVPIISEKNACSIKELKNKVTLRSFCSVWFWPIRIETFPQVFLQVLSHFCYFLTMLLTPAKVMIAMHFIGNVVNLYNKKVDINPFDKHPAKTGHQEILHKSCHSYTTSLQGIDYP